MPRKLTARQKAIAKGLPTYKSKRVCKQPGHALNDLTTRRTGNRQCLSCYTDRHDWFDREYSNEWNAKVRRWRANAKARPPPTPYERFMHTIIKSMEKQTMPAKSLPKDNARQAGRKTYNDVQRPCCNCGGTMRYVANGGCVECIKVDNRKASKTPAAQAANRERQARFRANQAAKKKALLDDI